jgi:hypothetical protein
MTSTINSVIGPARTILLVGLVALASVACASAGAVSGSASPPPASAAPSASAAPTPAPSLHVVLADELDSGATVDVVDQSGALVSARAAAIDERVPAEASTSGQVTIGNVDATTLWIGWTAGNCPDAHVLTVDPTGRSISITQPPFCGGDTIGVGRQLVLVFSQPMPAGDVTAKLVETGPAASASP